MRAGDIRTITVDGKKFDATYLGRGRHATAYRQGDTVYVFVHDEEEYMKEAVSMWVADDTPHVPNIKHHGNNTGRGGAVVRVYSMPYYRTIQASDKEAWGILKTLAEATERIRREKYIYEKPLSTHGLYLMNDVIEDTRGKVPESVTEALEALMNAGSNYGSGVTCEFGRRNIGVDGNGRIVFRDILFDAKRLWRELNAKIRANRGY